MVRKAADTVDFGSYQRSLAQDVPRETHHEHAEAVLERLRADSDDGSVVFAYNSFWICQRGVHVSRDPSQVEVLVARTLDGRKKCTSRRDYVDIARHAAELVRDDRFFEAAAIGVADPDSFYKVTETGEILAEPLKAEHRQRFTLARSIALDRDPDSFLEFLGDAFAGCKPGQIVLVQEMVGAVITQLAALHEIAFLFFGSTRAGKSVLARIIRALLPDEAVSAVAPHNWSNEYYLAAMAGSLLNTVGELDDERSIPPEFKTVIGRDLLTARHPTHRPFQFVNGALHLFNSNHFPPTKDASDSFWERWRVVHFPNTRAPADRDPRLADRLIRDELPEIAGWALHGAARLARQGTYSDSATHHDLLAKWRSRSNSAAEFLLDDEYVVLGDPAPSIPRETVWRVYRRWCTGAGRRAFGRNIFYDKLLEAGARYGVTKKREDNLRVFYGLSLTTRAIEFADRDAT